MKVLVTGGSGRLGQWAVADLLAHGHSVINADRVRPRDGRAPAEARSVRFIETHLGDVGQVAGAMAGCDAVIHLGAIPNPYDHADEVVFTNNTVATFAVLQAASLLGVKRAAIASSISILGTAYAPVPFAPVYGPVDEGHPLLNHDCYGLSKEVDERTAQMFHRRTGMQVAALRFHWIAYQDEAAERARQLAVDPGLDNLWRLLWGYVDFRDAATMCRLAIETDGIGFDMFNCTAADTLSEIPTEELIRRYCPEMEIRQPIPGCASGFSLAKAKERLGFEPAWSWKNS